MVPLNLILCLSQSELEYCQHDPNDYIMGKNGWSKGREKKMILKEVYTLYSLGYHIYLYIFN